MRKFAACSPDGVVYSVTLYGGSSMVEEERVKLSKVFSEVMEAVLGSAGKVLETQYDYNHIVDKYFGTPLPDTATDDEKSIVQRWENAYKAAFDAAFVAVFGTLAFVPDEAHFEVQME